MFVEPTPGITVDSVDACLPQTQCMRCEFASCLAYAQAIVRQNVAINRCPPGGSRTLALLAALTGQTCLQLDPVFGVYHPAKPVEIDEILCIGCTLCIKACPVDAIVGSARAMHTVVTAECSGCDLCIPVCPVDCIYTRDEDDMYYINPDECIDCAACEPVCPVAAIFAEDATPPQFNAYIAMNYDYFKNNDAADLKR